MTACRGLSALFASLPCTSPLSEDISHLLFLCALARTPLLGKQKSCKKKLPVQASGRVRFQDHLSTWRNGCGDLAEYPSVLLLETSDWTQDDCYPFIWWMFYFLPCRRNVPTFFTRSAARTELQNYRVIINVKKFSSSWYSICLKWQKKDKPYGPATLKHTWFITNFKLE